MPRMEHSKIETPYDATMFIQILSVIFLIFVFCIFLFIVYNGIAARRQAKRTANIETTLGRNTGGTVVAWMEGMAQTIPKHSGDAMRKSGVGERTILLARSRNNGGWMQRYGDGAGDDDASAVVVHREDCDGQCGFQASELGEIGNLEILERTHKGKR